MDCQAARRKYHLLENLMGEIERFESSGSLPDNVEYLEQRLDVGWYGRRCRKVRRDQLRDVQLGQSGLTVSLAGEIADTHWLDLPLPGTHFCSRQIPTFAFSESNLGVETTVDTCCLQLWSCRASPDHPLQPLGWSEAVFNPLLWPVWSCDCLAHFLSCLRDSETPLGHRLAEVWAQYGSYCSRSDTSIERSDLSTDNQLINISDIISVARSTTHGSLTASREIPRIFSELTNMEFNLR